MRTTKASRGRQGSLDRRGPDDPRPPLPPSPFYVSEPRGDAPPSTPFSSNPDDLDSRPGPRPHPRMPTLVPGDRITDRVYPPNGAASGWMLSWDLDAIARNSGHPARFYEVGEVSGLRWERYNGTGYWSLHFDDARVMRELPSWLAFGPNGEDVEAVLEAIADLDTHQVRRLDVPDGLEKFAIPIDRIEVPDGHALEKVADRARFLAMCWMEDRGWAIDSKAGGHYYHGCYFVYQLHDPHWLSAMGRAMNAASTAVIGGDMPAADAERARREWAEVLG